MPAQLLAILAVLVLALSGALSGPTEPQISVTPDEPALTTPATPDGCDANVDLGPGESGAVELGDDCLHVIDLMPSNPSKEHVSPPPRV